MDTIQCRISCTNISTCEVVPGYPLNTSPNYPQIKCELTVGEQHTIKLVCADRFGFDTRKLPHLNYTTPDLRQILSDDIPFTKVSDRECELTTDFVYEHDYYKEYGVIIYAQASEIFAKVDIKDENSTVDIESGLYLQGEYTITATANPGFEFQTIPYVSDSANHHYDFEKVNDSTYQINVKFVGYYTYTVFATAVKKSVILDRYGLITVYRPTKDELTQIAAKRWMKLVYNQNSQPGVSEEYLDTAKYVVSLLKLFVNVETTSREQVYFGPYDMGLECDVVGNDILTLDFGNVHICGIYGNSIDYEETEIEAYLPFIGFVTLSTSDFMDKEISLEYQINVINGDGLAVFKANGQVVASFSCNVSFKIPYQLGQGEYQNTDIQPNTNYLLNEPPFIYVKTHNAINPNENLPYHDTNFYACFGSLSGYTEAKEIDLHIVSPQITKQEIDEIKQLLENGVFL